jgi:N-acetylglutamate synthase-like GNAT family acetyltransferase
MDFRAYLPSDRDTCLAVFDSNVPDFFDPSERRGFEEFIADVPAGYFVMEHEGSILGCGGCYLTEDPALARLAWGMVRREWHRKGLGRLLLMFRLREISKKEGVTMVGVSTSQYAAPFFESQGFKSVGVLKDHYAPGFDCVEMVRKLAVCP